MRMDENNDSRHGQRELNRNREMNMNEMGHDQCQVSSHKSSQVYAFSLYAVYSPMVALPSIRLCNLAPTSFKPEHPRGKP